MACVHLLMEGKGMVVKSTCPFTGLLSEHFYTVCLSVGVSEVLQMMSHSRARVAPAQKLPLLPESGPAELPAPPGRELAFSSRFFSLLFISAAAESASVQDLLGVPLSLVCRPGL